jgi:hypothetical protein
MLRVWIADLHAPGFRQEAERQVAVLRGADEEADALDFIEAAAAMDDGPA